MAISNVSQALGVDADGTDQNLLAALALRRAQKGGGPASTIAQAKQVPFAPLNGKQTAQGYGAAAIGGLLSGIDERRQQGAMTQAAEATAEQLRQAGYKNITGSQVIGMMMLNPGALLEMSKAVLRPPTTVNAPKTDNVLRIDQRPESVQRGDRQAAPTGPNYGANPPPNQGPVPPPAGGSTAVPLTPPAGAVPPVRVAGAVPAPAPAPAPVATPPAAPDGPTVIAPGVTQIQEGSQARPGTDADRARLQATGAIPRGDTRPFTINADDTVTFGTNQPSELKGPVDAALGDLKTAKGEAQGAVSLIPQLHAARKALNSPGGIIAGSFAPQQEIMQRLGVSLGITDPNTLSNTQLLHTAIANSVMSGAKTIFPGRVTNADLTMLTNAAGGNGLLSRPVVNRIIAQRELSARNQINAYNAKSAQFLDAASKAGGATPYDKAVLESMTPVDAPQLYQPTQGEKPLVTDTDEQALYAPGTPVVLSDGRQAVVPGTQDQQLPPPATAPVVPPPGPAAVAPVPGIQPNA